MLRIKLFALFIAFALLALVRPRKCLELLEAADRGARRQGPFPQSPRAMHDMASRLAIWLSASMDQHAATGEMHKHIHAWLEFQNQCALPPPGWRCTRRAGHDGPCAAVAK